MSIKLSLFKAINDSRGRAVTVSAFSQLSNLIIENIWSAASFKNNHSKNKNFIGQSIFALDFDGGVTLEAAQAILNLHFPNINFIIGLTKSHTPENNRFRLLFELDREINAEEHKAFSDHFKKIFPNSDQACFDLSRRWFPCREIYLSKFNGEGLSLSFLSSISSSFLSQNSNPPYIGIMELNYSNRSKPTRIKWKDGEILGIGKRNVGLTSITGKILFNDRNQSLQTLIDSVSEYNRCYCSPPLPEGEIINICKSIFARDKSPNNKFANGIPSSSLKNAYIKGTKDCYSPVPAKWKEMISQSLSAGEGNLENWMTFNQLSNSYKFFAGIHSQKVLDKGWFISMIKEVAGIKSKKINAYVRPDGSIFQNLKRGKPSKIPSPSYIGIMELNYNDLPFQAAFFDRIQVTLYSIDLPKLQEQIEQNIHFADNNKTAYFENKIKKAAAKATISEEIKEIKESSSMLSILKKAVITDSANRNRMKINLEDLNNLQIQSKSNPKEIKKEMNNKNISTQIDQNVTEEEAAFEAAFSATQTPTIITTSIEASSCLLNRSSQSDQPLTHPINYRALLTPSCKSLKEIEEEKIYNARLEATDEEERQMYASMNRRKKDLDLGINFLDTLLQKRAADAAAAKRQENDFGTEYSFSGESKC
jgi:hypothetical protein